jgi:hypothetical protein
LVKPRRLRRLVAQSLAIGALTAGCGRDEELATGSLEPPIEVGGVCGTTTAHCLGETSLLRCEGRLWAEQTCSSICARTGRVAVGCYDRAYGDDCLCAAPDAGRAPDGPECAASRRCAGADSIEHCDRQGTRTESCADVCAALVPERHSAGCRPGARGAPDDCACTIEGMPCGDVPDAVCDGPSRLARCAGGFWTLWECAEECPGGDQASCGSWAGELGAGCRCEPLP